MKLLLKVDRKFFIPFQLSVILTVSVNDNKNLLRPIGNP